MKIRIRGKQWNLVRAHTGPAADGHCDHPDEPNRRIIVRTGLTGQKELEITLHEMLHAAFWDIDEDVIDGVGDDLSTVLWKLGYRKHK